MSTMHEGNRPGFVDRRQGTFPPIRMLHVITRLVRGGADENTLFTVRGLDKRRYVVDLVVGAGSELDHFGVIEGVQVHVVPELVRDPHPFKDVVALLKLAALIRRGRYQIVHTHTAKGGFLGRLAAALVGAPIIIHTVHGITFHAHMPPPLRWFYLMLERTAARFTHQFVAVGEDVRNIYVRSGVGPAHAYETIYSGMPLREYLEAGRMSDTERHALRAELGFAPEHRVVVMAARLEERKGHRYLFESLQRLRRTHPTMRALLVGDGAFRPELEAMCRSLGIDDIVTFMGFRQDLPRVLAAADISVLTSLWEGLPRVLVQSAAAGKPILTFDVEGAWEIVRDGNNGFVVPSRDVDLFTQRLDTLLGEHARARQFGEAGRQRVGEQWTVETMLERLDDLYTRWANKEAA
jgi:glycosyltransferase involved in cell wall biosynthesis